MNSTDIPQDTPQDTPQDVSQRIQRLIDGDLTADELAALEGELMESPEAMETYRDFLELHCALEEAIDGARMIRSQSVVPIDRILALQRKFTIKASLLGAAAVLLLTAVIMWYVSIPDPLPTLAKFQTAPGSDFSLTHDGEAKPPTGDYNAMVEGSRIVLRHGVAELKLPHDVRAVVEAPAEMILRDDRTLELTYGRALFQITTEEGQGFTVATPHQHIVDLGTSFGIDFQKGQNDIELHVLEGRVRVDGKDGNHGEIIKANRAVMLAGTKVLREIAPSSIGFLNQLPPKIDTLIKENFATGLIVGQNYVIQMDPPVIRDLAGNNSRGIDDDTTWKFTTGQTAAVPIAVASYAYTGTAGATDQPSNHRPSNHPQGLFLDPGNVKLTDNNLGNPAGWTSGNYVGFKGTDQSSPQVTFDLGTAHEVQTITVNSCVFGNPIKSIKISTSTDGATFSTPVNFTPNWSGLNAVSTSLEVPDWGTARYYRLDFSSPGEWLFLGEVTFGAVPTPSHGDTLEDLEKIHPAADLGQTLSKRDESHPVAIAVYPTENSTDATPGGQLKMVFNEPIKLGSGRVFIQNSTDWSESELVVGDHRLSIDGRVLTINPPIELKDGTRSRGWLAGWQTDAPVTFLNPSGNGRWYNNDDLQDKNPTQGLTGSMRSPGMTNINRTIRREIGSITTGSRYTVSAAIGVRADDAETKSTFLGYTIRLSSGDTVFAKLTSNTPPGPANSVTSVGFSWDATTLPAGVQPGDPLSIEIIPNRVNGPGYLDLNALRITVLGKSGR